MTIFVTAVAVTIIVNCLVDEQISDYWQTQNKTGSRPEPRGS